MISLQIPGFATLELRYLVSDYNGTLAVDGLLLPGVAERLTKIADRLEVHVITADTFGLARAQIAGLPVTLTVTPLEDQAQTKLDFVQKLGAASTVAIGNGRNDRKMLAEAAVGIALVQREGGAAASIAAADIVSASIHDALDLLENPKRMVATLCS
jgi:P-type E1-E2 ATPase